MMDGNIATRFSSMRICFLVIICVKIYLSGSNLKPHNSVLPVVKGLCEKGNWGEDNMFNPFETGYTPVCVIGYLIMLITSLSM